MLMIKFVADTWESTGNTVSHIICDYVSYAADAYTIKKEVL